ncbi:uncharacterized protein LOC119836106 [Zerene cesonia]|uniref:uncharacterized protein LOC119836106 n=1 Tax=Zerene cesonia TaxID=33412 RepID=UPI0018E53178|nr:uncharacterized protein LOC119836106 [Zerene cesonia]
MLKIIILSLVGCAVCAPYDAYVPLAKTTLTSSSHAVDHGSTHIVPAIPLAKTTLTQSSQIVDHGSSHIVHAPLHIPVAKTTSTHSNQVINHGFYHAVHPLIHEVAMVEHHPIVFPATSIYSYKTPDSAITHHSSEVHETVPYYAYH